MENFDLNNIKIDEKSYKNILVYYIKYVTIKECVKIYSLNRNRKPYFQIGEWIL